MADSTGTLKPEGVSLLEGGLEAEVINQGVVQRGKRDSWIMITQCAWCCSIKVGRWYLQLPGVKKIVLERAFRLPTGGSLIVSLSHGICPECTRGLVGRGL